MKKIIVLMIILLPVIAFNVNGQVSLIVNKSVNIESLDKSQLLDIFSLTSKKWNDGEKIVVFDLKGDSPAKSAFYDILEKSPNDLKKIWMRKQLTGEGKAPAALSSDYEMLERVATTPGAIGYVAESVANDRVKIIKLK